MESRTNYLLQLHELRVDNYVYEKGIPIRVQLWILQEIRAGNKDFTPIELTPELLLKSGFVDLSEPIRSHNRFVLNRKIDDYCIQHFEVIDLETFVLKNYYTHNEQDEFDEYVCQIDLVYLHQLQNLYFALTGEELQIKQPL
jgi:hypothetical protein